VSVCRDSGTCFCFASVVEIVASLIMAVVCSDRQCCSSVCCVRMRKIFSVSRVSCRRCGGKAVLPVFALFFG